MGYDPDDIADMRRVKLLHQSRRELAERRLHKSGLGVKAIHEMTATELESAATRVDALIEELQSALKTGTDGHTYNIGGTVFHIGDETTAARATNELLQLALERKELILERLRELQTNAQVEAINRIAENITEVSVKTALESSLRTLQTQNKELAQRLEEVDRTRNEVAEQATIADIERYERKAKVWRSFLEKESVASIIGTFVLLALTATMIVFAFIGRATPELLNNVFLIVVGYFFGQSTASRPG